MPAKTILIVEDEAVWRRLLARLFGEHGYTVIQAISCGEGLDALRRYKIDCAIVEFNLGDSSGDIVCAAIRERDNGFKTPVIFFTADPGAADYMSGPHRADMLVFKGSPVMALPGLMSSLLGPAH